MTKVACIGGGSSYFGRVLPDLAVTRGLAGSEVVLYDIDLDRALAMAEFGARMAQESGTGLRVRVSASLADALDGADFVLSSIGGSGVGGSGVYGADYHVQDMVIPARYGIYQIVGDTCGPAGMMMALRSAPIHLEVCQEMSRRCPRAILFNHSNPMAVLCRAMTKYTGIITIGICHGVQYGIVRLGELLGVNPEELDVVWVGTNHYHWYTGISHHGEDLYPRVRSLLAEREPSRGERMTQKLSTIYGYRIVYPEDDHALEFYPFLAELADGAQLPYGQRPWLPFDYGSIPEPQPDPSDTERLVASAERLKRLREELAKVRLPEAQPSPLTDEGIGALLEAIALGRRGVFIVNVPNRGCVPNLPDYAILEVEAVTDSTGVRGVYMGDAPLVLQGILHRRIVWQELVADAAVKGDRNLALQALLLDDMAIVPEKAEAMLHELLAASKPMLPRFFS